MMKKLLIAAAMSCAFATAQVPVAPIVQPHVTFVNASGGPCFGCTLQTFAAGSTTPLATYTDATGTAQNQNPIPLDAAGGADIWLGANSYKFVLLDPSGATIWSVDQVTTIGALHLTPGQVAGTAIVQSPAGSQTITQPTGTTLSANNLSLTGPLTMTAPLTSSSTSLFSPTSNFTSSTYQTNGGVVADGVNLTSLFQFTNLFQNGVASLVGALETNTAATATEVDGVLGVTVQNGGPSFAVGLRGTSECLKQGSCWGANFLTTDVATTGAHSTLWGFESDTNVYNTTTTGQGGAITGFFAVQPAANMNALNIDVVSAAGANNGWNVGIDFAPGAISGDGDAIFLSPFLNTVSQNSQNITFESETSGGALFFGHVFEDPTGTIRFCTASSFTNCAGVNIFGDVFSPHQLESSVATGTAPLLITSTTPVANLITENQPIAFANGSGAITPNTKLFSNVCTMASGTCTIAIPSGVFGSTPVCPITPINASPAGTVTPTFWVESVTNTSLILASSSGSFSGNVMAVCFGQ